MTHLKTLLAKIPAPLLGLLAFCGVFLALGQIGYRSGALVTVGPAQLDPEFVRAVAALLAAVLAYSGGKLPYIDVIRGFLVQFRLVGLTDDQDRRLKWLSREMPADWQDGGPGA